MNVHRFVFLALLAAGLSATGQEVEPKTAKQKASYGFGLNMGRSMRGDGLLKDDVDFALLVQGLRDALNDEKVKITEQDFKEAFDAVIAPKLEERAKAAAAKWKPDNEAYLAKNKTAKGVKTTASGLQYRVLKSGDGKTPKATDKVRVQYKGSYINGSVFDASEKPIEFKVTGVIKGWTEALQLMKEGDKFELVVPADLAYGADGVVDKNTMQQIIPPDSTLVFEVELVQVMPAVPANTTKPKMP